MYFFPQIPLKIDQPATLVKYIKSNQYVHQNIQYFIELHVGFFWQTTTVSTLYIMSFVILWKKIELTMYICQNTVK